MLGLHLLVTVSARFFVPALRTASGLVASVPLIHSQSQGWAREYRRATLRVGPVVASALDVNALMLRTSFFAGLAAGLAALILGATCAKKAIRSGRSRDAWVPVLKFGALEAAVKLNMSPAAEAKREPAADLFMDGRKIGQIKSSLISGDMEDPLRRLKLVAEWDDETEFMLPWDDED
jgi:hypothetical protein